MSITDEYKNGKLYIGEITVEYADEFSKLFGEGSPALTELIKYCIQNKIITLASCKGHPEKI